MGKETTVDEWMDGWIDGPDGCYKVLFIIIYLL